MEHLPKKTCQNGISYTLVGDYYIPDLQLPEENRPIGIWGRMHKAYLEYSGLRVPPIRNGIPTKRRMIPTSFLHAIRRNVLSVRK